MSVFLVKCSRQISCKVIFKEYFNKRLTMAKLLLCIKPLGLIIITPVSS